MSAYVLLWFNRKNLLKPRRNTAALLGEMYLLIPSDPVESHLTLGLARVRGNEGPAACSRQTVFK